MWRNRKSMAFKLAGAISVSITIIFAVIFFYSYFFSKQLLLNNIQYRAQEVLAKNVNEVERVLSDITTVPQNLAPVLSSVHLPEATIERVLRDSFSHETGAYGFWVAYDPYLYDPSMNYFASYVWKENGELKYDRLGSADYDYFNFNWYKIPKERQKSFWSDPYYDEGASGTLITTFSVPFYSSTDGERKFLGVTGADISLAWLQELTTGIKISESGYAFLITKNGTFIAHPRKDLILNETMFTAAEKLDRPYLIEAGRRMTAGETGDMGVMSAVTGQPARLFFAPIPATGWSLGIVIMESELLAGIVQLHHRLLVIGIGGLLMILFGVVLIARRMSRPLMTLTTATLAFADGNMDVADIDIRSGDEIEALNRAFNDLKRRLKEKMEELKEYSAGLETKIAERTREIVAKNEQLIQQEKLASLGGLAAGIAHEIKNPLNFVTNFAGVTTELVEELSELMKESGGEECQTLLKDIRDNVVKINEHGKRADSIVKGMLMHSRAKSGERQDVDVSELLTESINLAYHGFRARDKSFNVRIGVDIPSDLPRINVVPQNISRVFLNIIDNAFYSVNEKAKIKRATYAPEFSASARLEDNMIVFRLRDNGLGVPEEIVQKVFNPFFTTKPAGGGTGLGLSISHDIVVKEHGGSLTLETVIGEFAEFTIKLPLK